MKRGQLNHASACLEYAAAQGTHSEMKGVDEILRLPLSSRSCSRSCSRSRSVARARSLALAISLSLFLSFSRLLNSFEILTLI